MTASVFWHFVTEVETVYYTTLNVIVGST